MRTEHSSGVLCLRLIAVALIVVSPTSLGGQSFELLEATIEDVHSALENGHLTCRSLVQGYINRIEAFDQRDPYLNAVQHLNERALEEADALDVSMKSAGISGPLHCIPVLLKDQVETADMPTTYGSALFQDFLPDQDATITARMKNAGAIILAKTTMGEFASRYVGSAFGVIRNAYDPDRNPSGSSGGTATGIAANFGMVGIGEDTGGSVRGPAAVLNLVGLRPTLQLVSRHGMMPANPTQDTMGPITRTVRDAAILLDVITGYDPEDPITAYAEGRIPETYTASLNLDRLRGARIGVVREPMDASTDTSSDDYQKVKIQIDRAIRDLVSLGALVVDPLVVPELKTLQTIGNNFETERAMDDYLSKLSNAPVTTLKEILLSGVVIPWRARSMMESVGKTTNDPGYLEVIRKRQTLRRNVLKVMADQALDAIVYATFDHQPTLIKPDVETNPSPADEYGRGDNRGLSPATGFPALTVPAGFTTDQLPVGLEFLGRPFTEEMLFGFGYAYEQATHHRRPPPTTPRLTSRR
ncbi:MAG: amidase family protein [Gemmatimonadota bacterium]|nr:amidase family protein [Gemmatimonadota bacterium]